MALASLVVLQAELCPQPAAFGCLPWLELLPAQVMSQGASGPRPGMAVCLSRARCLLQQPHLPFSAIKCQQGVELGINLSTGLVLQKEVPT